MTLNSHFAFNTVFRVESLSMNALVLRHIKTDGDAYCQQQRCSPWSEVCGDISLMSIFIGVRC